MSGHSHRKYVMLVVTEPIEGLSAYRCYGPYDTSDEVWADLEKWGIRTADGKLAEGYTGAGYLPVRDPATLVAERP